MGLWPLSIFQKCPFPLYLMLKILNIEQILGDGPFLSFYFLKSINAF